MSGLLNYILLDPDVDSRFLIKNSCGPWLILIPYIVFVKFLGPRIMKDRRPYTLQRTLVAYNLILVIGNVYLTSVFTYYGWTRSQHLCGLKNNPDFMRLRSEVRMIAWHIYLMKYLELLDTVFFVLRKKDKQISFLHIFHHTILPIAARYTIYSEATGFYIMFIAGLNSFVHVIMYTYYGLAALGPQLQKYLWWKKYLTTFQIGQFVAILVYMLLGILTGCENLDSHELGIFCFISALCFLFINFYAKTFKKK